MYLNGAPLPAHTFGKNEFEECFGEQCTLDQIAVMSAAVGGSHVLCHDYFSCDLSPSPLLQSRSVSVEMTYDVSCAANLVSISNSEIETTLCFLTRLESALLYRISEFVPRLEHFKVWNRVNTTFNNHFSVQRYFSGAVPLISSLFTRDVAYFKRYLRNSFFNSDMQSSSIVTVTNRNRYPMVRRESNVWQMLKFYLSFYDKFVALQQRYNREMAPRRRSIRHRSDSNTSVIAVFPTLIRTICFGYRCESLNYDEFQWLLDLIRNIDCNSRLVEWDLSNCHLTDAQCNAIAQTVVNRRYFFNCHSMDLSHNRAITNQSMPYLFTAFGERCPKLMKICLDYTNVTNKTCAIIGNYFKTYIDFAPTTSVFNELCNVTWVGSQVTNEGETHFADIVLEASSSNH